MIIKVKGGSRIEFFNRFSFMLRYDSVGSTFSFVAYFDPNNEQHRFLFQPGQYRQIDVEHNDELLIRGTILNSNFSLSSQKQLVSISGYSLTGVLEDSQIPTNLYPLQSDGKTLKEITDRLISNFDFSLVVDSTVSSRVNAKYDISTASENQTIKSYLGSLASQRNIILSHTPEGDLLYTEAKTTQLPFFQFEQTTPETSITLSFNGQALHSNITVQKQSSVDGGNAGESSIINPFVVSGFRPSVKSQNSGTDIDTIQAARNELSSELKNITLTIKTSMWEINGKILKPNTIITVKSDELFLFNRTKWFVESIKFDGDETKTIATLTCVLPEVYNNQTPKYIFNF